MNGVIIFGAWIALCRVLIPTAESSGGQKAVKSAGWLFRAFARCSCGMNRWMQPRWKICKRGLSVITAHDHEGTPPPHTHTRHMRIDWQRINPKHRISKKRTEGGA